MPNVDTVSNPRLLYKRGPKSVPSVRERSLVVHGTTTLTVNHDSRGALCTEHGKEANYASFPQGLLDEESLEGDYVCKLVHGLAMEMLKVGSQSFLILEQRVGAFRPCSLEGYECLVHTIFHDDY